MVMHGQLVIGPAGSGKSSYCSLMEKHYRSCRRQVYVVNLDPAAEVFDYAVNIDIRELIHVDDVMEDEQLNYGPNGALIYSMNFLLDNFNWLGDQLSDEAYYIFDCPGQIELYTHIPVMKLIANKLMDLDFVLCSVFLLDAPFLVDGSKYVFGILSSLSSMMMLSLPHVTILTKVDLICRRDRERLEKFTSPELWPAFGCPTGKDFSGLIGGLSSVVQDYGMIQFAVLDCADDESIMDVATKIDMAIQYYDYAEYKEMDLE